MVRRVVVLAQWWLCAGLFAVVVAGEVGVRAQDAGVAAAVDERVPPRALSIPPLQWPADEPVPAAGSIEVVVRIERDGQPELEDCTEAESVCAALRAALASARFAPASVNGEPSAARVQVRFALTHAESRDAGTQVEDASAATADAAARPDAAVTAHELYEYGARARLARQKPLATALELEEIREVPGAFGDPFRAIEALPGVVPVLTGLPYVYVRGAPPAATAYFFDDIQMPALFHLGLGPAVVHPAMVGGIDFYPGVAPARYGRKTGGTVAGKAQYRELKPGIHGELELRLVDMQAYIAAPIRKRGRLEVAGRFGFPGLLSKALDKHVVVQYWDYQLRSVIPLTRNSEATVIALGSYDMIGARKNGHLERDLELQFHRVELRLTQRQRGFSLNSALSAGFERSGLGDTLNVQALRFGPKLWVDVALRRASLRLGADMMGTIGKIYDEESQRIMSNDPHPGFSFSDNPIYRSAAARNVFGVYAELNLPLGDDWSLEAGLRSDTWITSGDAQPALEPRSLLRFQANDWLGLHAAFGTAYQPAVFLLPLPGVSDVALDRGLQRAIQYELGARFQLPAAFSIENKLFAHFYKNMLAIESFGLDDVECNDPAPMAAENAAGISTPPIEGTPIMCKRRNNFGRLSARAYGSEWLIRRASSEPISGWLSYTLSKATAHSDDGKSVTPNFDVRHVANLVLQWRINRRFNFALRGVGFSGRFPIGATTTDDPRERARLPPFFRGDLQLSRTWQKPWGELRLTLDWLNFTFQKEPLSWDCTRTPPGGKCKVQHVEFPITLPLLGVRATY